MAPDEEKLRETLEGIASLYTRDLDRHGISPKSVGWKDKASQRLRFENLSQVIDWSTAHEGISINDLGCGYGAMFRYLDEMPSVRLTNYYGYEISEEMLAAAEKFVADTSAKFIQSPRVTKKTDYSFVSGTFNAKLGASDKIWTEYFREMLMDLATKSTSGFAFNALTTYVD